MADAPALGAGAAQAACRFDPDLAHHNQEHAPLAGWSGVSVGVMGAR